MLGFGSANFNQGTFGKGVMVGHGSLDSTATVQSFGIAQWEATNTLATGTSVVLMFGGLLQGGTSYMQGTGTMYSYPVATWAGFGDTVTVQGTILTSGHLAWDKQDLSDATWTTQTVD
jgi:hypothetical protein